MPYVDCSGCGLTNFTAAYWSSVETCSSCGRPLPHPRRSANALAFAGARERALSAAIVRENRLRHP